ncbi:hypothetical protein D5018_07590 [Parashewanella curva]|uniref:Uncharacterized protein n=1 Tax=Parashewanella curva TaxID=2338552 RepID=A0A3L8PY35_9GAMM|nr:hypothetical protein [Parashewanella curva]RLV60251.1 hypothetical protein D5018_07590 [Parashewanella curva]
MGLNYTQHKTWMLDGEMSINNSGISSAGLQVKLGQGNDEPKVETSASKVFNLTQVGLEAPSSVPQKADEHLDVKSSIEATAQSHKDAENQGVNLKKKAFIKNLAIAIGSGVAVGATLMATIGTLGATTPLLFLATTHLGVAVGDSICSYMDWKGKRPDLLPMGQDSVGNMAFAALKKLGYQDPKAFNFADKISMATRGLLAFATLSSNETIREKAPAVIKTAVKQGYYSAQASHIKQQDALATPVKLSQLSQQSDKASSVDESTPLLKTSEQAQDKVTELEEKHKHAEDVLNQKLKQVSDRRLQWSQKHSQAVQFDPSREQLTFRQSQPTGEPEKPTEVDTRGNDKSAARAKAQKSVEYRAIQHEIGNLRTQLDYREKIKAQHLQHKADQLKHSPLMQRSQVVNKKGVESFKKNAVDETKVNAELRQEARRLDNQTEKLKAEIKDKRMQREKILSAAMEYYDIIDGHQLAESE